MLNIIPIKQNNDVSKPSVGMIILRDDIDWDRFTLDIGYIKLNNGKTEILEASVMPVIGACCCLDNIMRR